MEHHSRTIDFYNFSDNDFRAIIQSQNGNHVYACQISNLGQWCACIGYRVRKKCNHLNVLLEEIVKFGELRSMQTAHYKTNINAINSSLMGGIPKGTLVGFYGEPQSGKSTSSIWVLLDTMNITNQNGIIIDTETGIAKHFLPDILERYNAKNGTNIGIKHIKVDYRSWLKNKSAILPYKELYDDKKSQQVLVVDATNLSELLLLVGRPAEIDMEKRKPEIVRKSSEFWRNVWDIPLSQLLDNPNSEDEYCGFVLDSMTAPMKMFGTANQNYPVRDTAQSIIINQLSDIINFFEEMIGINILHASRPPQDSTRRAIPVGGKSVGHGHKYIIQFSGAETKGQNTVVNVSSYRLPTQIGNLQGFQMTINNSGVF